jgi:hypothetical protein
MAQESLLCSFFFANQIPDSELLEIPAALSSRQVSGAGLWDLILPVRSRSVSGLSACALSEFPSFSAPLPAEEMPATAATVVLEKPQNYVHLCAHSVDRVIIEDDDADELPRFPDNFYARHNPDLLSAASTANNSPEGRPMEIIEDMVDELPKIPDTPSEPVYADLDVFDAFFHAYVHAHCKIDAKDLKPNAVARMRDLRALFTKLERKKVIRITQHEGGTDSIFGFSRMFVDAVDKFNDEVSRMVLEDVNRCWMTNGRRSLVKPTNTVYELLRQLGVHPVKGTRGKASADMALSLRDFMVYKEYAFSLQRLERNCSRLKIGVIGNRRT